MEVTLMPKLREQVDFVVGVDTHKLTHTASVIDINGAELATATVSADASGYLRLLAFGRRHAPARRVWAIEGTGSYGGGLMTALLEHGEGVVEIDRPVRPARRNGAKSDALDATRAAREVLSREHLAQPRCRGEREALRVLLCTRQGAVGARRRALCHLKALVVTAPEAVRQPLRMLSTEELVTRCARLRTAACPLSLAPPSSPCARLPAGRSPSKPRPTASKRRLRDWSAPWPRNSSTNPVSGH